MNMELEVHWRNCHYLPIHIGPCLLVTAIIHPVYYGASESILCYEWLKKQRVRACQVQVRKRGCRM